MMFGWVALWASARWFSVSSSSPFSTSPTAIAAPNAANSSTKRFTLYSFQREGETCNETGQKMSETLVSYGCVLSEIASAPSSHSEGEALLPRRCCSTAWLPPSRRSLGFAPPPHDEFALLASAHTDAPASRH